MRIDCKQGVYVIENIVNGKKYVGQSSNIHLRWVKHRNDLANGTHHNYKLQADWEKYGGDAFVFKVLDCTANRAHLDVLEKMYVEKFDSVKNGYNLTYGGINCKVASEVKEKMSASHKGYIKSVSHRANLSQSLTGKVTSTETIQRIKNTQVDRGQSYVNDDIFSKSVYEDFNELVKDGVKKNDASYMLVEKYNISIMTVYRIRKKYKNTCC